MFCASRTFRCPSLSAKGRRNRLTAISQLPRHQSALSGGLSELSGKGVGQTFSVAFLFLLPFCFVWLAFRSRAPQLRKTRHRLFTRAHRIRNPARPLTMR